MFTGIITDMGEVRVVEMRGDMRARIGCDYDMAGDMFRYLHATGDSHPLRPRESAVSAHLFAFSQAVSPCR